MSPGSTIRSALPSPSFLGGLIRPTSSGVISGLWMCSTLALTCPMTGDKPRAAEAIIRLRYRRGPRHLGEQIRGVLLIWGECDPNMAIRNNAFVGAVGIDDLPNILCHQVCFDPVSRHVRKCIRKNVHAAEAGELIDQQQQPVLVRL